MIEGEDELLSLYQAELAYLRNAGASFSRRHPRVAQRLDLTDHGSTDPQVERLIESFAFLTARLQRLYNAQFPEIPTALLGVLYPDLVAPVPSMAIVAFRPDPEQTRSLGGVVIPRETTLFATPANGATCWFRTAYPVTLWPIEAGEIAFEPPSLYDFLDRRPEVSTVLRVRLNCLGPRRFGEFSPGTLRLFLHGARRERFSLYELLCNQLHSIAILPDAATGDPRLLGADQLVPVGFAPGEAVLPNAVVGHQGYRLLQEYFAFPDKFLFLDLHGLEAGSLGTESSVDLLFLLRERPRQRLTLEPGSIRLNCAPAINLFPHISEPIRIDHTRTEYRISPDSRLEASMEIHSIQRLTRSSTIAGAASPLSPLFSFSHLDALEPGQAMWIVRRQPAGGAGLRGSEMVLSLVDPDLNPLLPAADIVFAHALCTNRGLAEQLPPQAALQIEIDAPLRDIVCLMRPTPQREPPTQGAMLWRLVSHLSVNHLSLDGPDGLAALREILLLHAGAGDAAGARQVAGLTRLGTRRVVRRIGHDAWRGFCRGLEISLEFDESEFAGGSAFLLAAVLDRFLGLYVAANSFTEVIATSRQRDGIWKRWPARTGDALVL